MAVSGAGQLYTWGNGYEGSRPVTGHGHCNNVLIPTLVEALKNEVVVQAAAGWDHALCVTSQGHVYTWGGNPSGALGTGSSSNEAIPTRVVKNGFDKVTSVSEGAWLSPCRSGLSVSMAVKITR